MKKQLFALILLLPALAAQAQKIPYTNCKNCWLPDSLGNHRVVLTFNGTGKAAKVIIPWRRRDNDPENKRVIIEDAQTKQKVTNVKLSAINRESGEVVFEPTSGKGTYFVYYMPYKNEGRSNYPRGIYLKPENTASSAWLNSLGANIPAATVKEFQSIDAFNSFYPMEVIATKNETDALIAKHKNEAFLVFPEDRLNSIRMTKDLPQRWIELGPQSKYVASALRGENFSFQLGVYALQNLDDVKVTFSDLKTTTGKKIPASALFCINTGGTAYDGSLLTKTVSVTPNTIQALWCGIDVPASATAAVYTGKAIISNGKTSKEIQLSIKVNPALAKNGGVDEPWKMTRLGWLNSTMAQKNTVIAPYKPLVVKNNTVELLGRKVEVNSDGFPKQIQTFFTPEMTEYADAPNNLLTEAIHFHFLNAAGKNIKLKSQGLQFTKQEPGTVQWTATSANDSLQMEVTASMEFDGFIAYTVKVKALQDVNFKDITMHIPFKRDVAKYMMGLGQKGGYRPENFEWKWDVSHKNQDGAWIGFHSFPGDEWVIDIRVDRCSMVNIDHCSASLFYGIDRFVGMIKTGSPLKIGIDGMERRNK